jgi:transcriptional regulator with XRE-family HTH domain
MTTPSEQRPATLTELVAQEIDSVRGRRRMSQAQLARTMGKTPMWVSLRLRGLQPIDMNDLLAFARALDVNVHQLLPSPEIVAEAAIPSATVAYLALAERLTGLTSRPSDNRPKGRSSRAGATGVGHTAYLSRGARRRTA